MDNKCPSDLQSLAQIETCSPSKSVVRILGLNPGSHTLQGTNTFLVGKGSQRVLIDTGEDITASNWARLLVDEVIVPNNVSISHILLTHGHGDHQGGVVTLLALLKQMGVAKLPIVHKRIVVNGAFPARDFVCHHLEDGQIFKLEADNLTLQVLYSPGHTDDHVCFVLKEELSLFSGDTILGCGTSVFDNLHSYMNSLRALRNKIAPPASLQCSDSLSFDNMPISVIYPGHGPTIIGATETLKKVDEYLSHRQLREEQVLHVLAKQEKSKLISTWELVDLVYTTPRLTAFFVRISAQFNLHHHLEKLLEEQKVIKVWPDLWRLA